MDYTRAEILEHSVHETREGPEKRKGTKSSASRVRVFHMFGDHRLPGLHSLAGWTIISSCSRSCEPSRTPKCRSAIDVCSWPQRVSEWGLKATTRSGATSPR